MVEIYVNHSWKLQRIEAEPDYFIVKIYLELLETKPYSYFYKWNGRLALEFLATSEPIPLKRVLLAKRGIPLYEARAIIPEWIQKTLPEEFDTEEAVSYTHLRPCTGSTDAHREPRQQIL